VSDLSLGLLAWLVALLVLGMIGWILADVLRHGLPRLSWAFLVELPGDAGRSGGIRSILISTLLILGVCLAVSVPIGLATAVFLAEFQRGHRGFGQLVRYSLDTLAGVPSIVFGLFGNAFFSISLGLGFSILSGGLTLACMVLPLMIRSMETALRAIPAEHRLAAAALGLPQRVSLLHILLPAAAPGLAVGLILGIGRALAETAALLFTSGYVDRLPGSLLDSGRALSVHIFDLAMNVPGGASQASATALVLVGLVLVINAFTGWAARRWLACLASTSL
jgi:phosphate transport system permease protein